jgi:hypothetical protein
MGRPFFCSFWRRCFPHRGASNDRPSRARHFAPLRSSEVNARPHEHPSGIAEYRPVALGWPVVAFERFSPRVQGTPPTANPGLCGQLLSCWLGSLS